LRTLDEIAQWSTMLPGEKMAVWDALAERRVSASAAPGDGSDASDASDASDEGGRRQ
jgi:predicted Fe-S protein YdhL (DUF1289 family)